MLRSRVFCFVAFILLLNVVCYLLLRKPIVHFFNHEEGGSTRDISLRVEIQVIRKHNITFFLLFFIVFYFSYWPLLIWHVHRLAMFWKCCWNDDPPPPPPQCCFNVEPLNIETTLGKHTNASASAIMHATRKATTNAKIAWLSTHQRDDQRARARAIALVCFIFQA